MKAKCLKEYGVSLTKGKIYDVTFPPDAKNGINVFDIRKGVIVCANYLMTGQKILRNSA